MLVRKLPLLLSIGLACACAGGRNEAESPVVVKTASPEAQESVPESVDVPVTELERAAVVETVEAGLGRFLQEVELAESLTEGKFEGFRIVRFRDPSLWRGVGLRPGDVIVSINDSAIERPEQAYAVFVGLKSADALEVSYLRAGQPLRLSLPIVGEMPADESPKTAPALPNSEKPPVDEPREKGSDASKGAKDG